MAAKALSGSDAVMKALEALAKKLGGGSVSIGFINGETYPNGTPVAAAAYFNEFGHGGNFPSPPRPFFRTMISKESSTWGPKMAALVKSQNYDGGIVLAMMGEDIRGSLQASIRDFSSPALSPTTLMLRATFGNFPGDIRVRDVLQAQHDVAEGKKGASGTQAHPLIWTGRMLGSVTYEVTHNGP